MSDLQQAVDGLVEAVEGEDVLFVLYWRLQLPEGSFDLEHSSTGLSALQTAVGDPSHSKRQRLIIEILLLAGAHPDSYGSVTAARLRASDVSNSAALALFERWEHGAREEAKDAAWLLSLTDEGDSSPLRTLGFDFIVANDLETEATKLDQQRVEEEARALVEQGEGSAQPSSATKEAALSAPPATHASDVGAASGSPPLTPAPAPQESAAHSTSSAPLAPPVLIAQDPSTVLPSPPPPSSVSPSAKRQTDGPPDPPATKKVRVEVNGAPVEYPVPIFKVPDLWIGCINPSSSNALVEVCLRAMLPSHMKVRLTPRHAQSVGTPAVLEAEGPIDVAAIARMLDGTEVEGSLLRVRVFGMAAPHVVSEELRTPDSTKPTPVTPSAESAVELGQVFVLLNSVGAVNDYAVRKLFRHALTSIGHPSTTIASIFNSQLQARRTIVLSKPVPAEPVLAEMRGKAIGGSFIEIYTVDQAPPVPAHQPPRPYHLKAAVAPAQAPPLQLTPELFTDFVVHGIPRNTTSLDSEQAFAIVRPATEETVEIKGSVVSGAKGKLVGYVRVCADIDGALAADLMRGAQIRQREVQVEWKGAPSERARSTSGTSMSPAPRSTSPQDGQLASSPKFGIAPPSLHPQVCVENLGRTASAAEVGNTFASVVGRDLIKSVELNTGGGSAIVTFTESVNLVDVKERMAQAEIGGRKLVLAPAAPRVASTINSTTDPHALSATVDTPTAPGRWPVRPASAQPRSLSPTSARGIVAQRQPSPHATQAELDRWALEAQEGRFPADYSPWPPRAVLDQLTGPERTWVANTWRCEPCRYWPPKERRTLCRGRTCIFAHGSEELRRNDGSMVNPPAQLTALPPARPPQPSASTSTAPASVAPRSSSSGSFRAPSSEEAGKLPARSADVALPTRSESRSSSSDMNPPAQSTAPSSLSPAAQQRTLDEARLASLGLSERDLATAHTLMQPINTPPSEGFDRTARLEATFGYVSPEDARLALRAQSRRRTFADDERSQLAYETFLRAQTGESKDHYTVFFAELCRFNNESRLFEQTAKQALAAARATSGGE